MDNRKNQHVNGILLMMFSIIIWGEVPIVMKLISHQIPSGIFTFLRYFICFCITCLLAIINHHFIIPVRKAMIYVLLGAVTLFPYSFLFMQGLTYIPSSTAGIINGLTVIFSLLIAVVFFQRRIKLTELTGIGISCTGLILFFYFGGKLNHVHDYYFGLFITIIAVFCFALYSFFIKKVNTTLTTGEMAYVYLGVCIPSAVVALFETTSTQFILTKDVIEALLYMSLFATYAAYHFYNRALHIFEVYTANILLTTVPIIAYCSGVYFLNEVIHVAQIACLPFILWGIFQCIYQTRQASARDLQNVGQSRSTLGMTGVTKNPTMPTSRSSGI